MSFYHADKWGPVGSLIAALCCLGVAPFVAALSAAGLEFLLTDRILLPLLVLSLAATVVALRFDRRKHGRFGPLGTAVGGGVIVLGGLWVSSVLTVLGLGLVLVATVWNWWLVRRNATCAVEEG
ncbi:MAG: hypothetical protein Kow00109_18140 [Acidobacteriota bacterium]